MNHHELHQLASGRRLIHFCLFGWLGMWAFRLNSTPLLLPMLLVLGGAAMAGSAKLTGVLAMSPWARWTCVLGAALPFAGLLVMGWLSSKARQQLLAAGWRLGMFEARAPTEGGRAGNGTASPLGDDSR
jgi:hypothetical protein